jgi:uncharacterized membrane protein YfcA
LNIYITGLILFVIAAVLSLFGKGGGEFYVPVFLTMGIDFNQAASSSLFILMVSGTVMMIVYNRKALLDWKTGLAVVAASAAGSFTGGYFSSDINPAYLKITFAVLLLISAFFMSQKEKNAIPVKAGYIWKRDCCGEKYAFPVFVVLPLIFVTGFLAGMVGISGGGLIVPLLIILGGMPLRIAFATNSIMVLFSSASGFIGHGIKSEINWKFTLISAAFAASGALLGSAFSSRVKVSSLKKIFVWVLVAAAFWMILKIYI